MRLTLLLTLFGLSFCAVSAQPPATLPNLESQPGQMATTQPIKPIPVAAIWYERGYPFHEQPSKFLIVGIWSDGTVIWSDDRAPGGGSHFRTNVGVERVEKLLHDLASVQFFSPSIRQVNFGPDSSYTVVAARAGNQHQGSDPGMTHRRRIQMWPSINAASTRKSQVSLTRNPPKSISTFSKFGVIAAS